MIIVGEGRFDTPDVPARTMIERMAQAGRVVGTIEASLAAVSVHITWQPLKA
jgi:hypothetical protein